MAKYRWCKKDELCGARWIMQDSPNYAELCAHIIA